MLVIDDDLRHRLQTLQDDVLNQTERGLDFLLSELGHEVELQTPQVPLASHAGVIVLCCLLDGHVCQVDKVVGNVVNICGVPRVRESCKPFPTEIDC